MFVYWRYWKDHWPKHFWQPGREPIYFEQRDNVHAACCTCTASMQYRIDRTSVLYIGVLRAYSTTWCCTYKCGQDGTCCTYATWSRKNCDLKSYIDKTRICSLVMSEFRFRPKVEVRDTLTFEWINIVRTRQYICLCQPHRELVTLCISVTWTLNACTEVRTTYLDGFTV